MEVRIPILELTGEKVAVFISKFSCSEESGWTHKAHPQTPKEPDLEPHTSQPNSSLQKEFCWETLKNGRGFGVKQIQAVLPLLL